MANQDGSLVRSLRGPITLITLGLLFALQNFTRYKFEQTWPVLLIVFGLLSILRRSVEPVPPPPPPRQAPPPPPPPVYPTGYAQSPYAQPPAGTSGGPVKGGFGSSAPSRPADVPPVTSSDPEGGTHV